MKPKYKSAKTVITNIITKHDAIIESLSNTNGEHPNMLGIHLYDLFRDIDESIVFGRNNFSETIHIGYKLDSSYHNKGISFKERTKIIIKDSYLKEAKILQRIILLKDLEEDGLVFWVNNNSNEFIPTLQDGDWSMIPLKDHTMHQFILHHHNSYLVPTDELKRLKKNRYRTIDEVRYEYQLWVSIITLAVSFAAAILSAIGIICQSN